MKRAFWAVLVAVNYITTRSARSFASAPVGHCEEPLATKPCPEQSEGTLETAAGFALAATFRVRLLCPFPKNPGTGRARNDIFWSVKV